MAVRSILILARGEVQQKSRTALPFGPSRIVVSKGRLL